MLELAAQGATPGNRGQCVARIGVVAGTRQLQRLQRVSECVLQEPAGFAGDREPQVNVDLAVQVINRGAKNESVHQMGLCLIEGAEPQIGQPEAGVQLGLAFLVPVRRAADNAVSNEEISSCQRPLRCRNP